MNQTKLIITLLYIVFITSNAQTDCVYQIGNKVYDLRLISSLQSSFSFRSKDKTYYWNICGKSPIECENPNSAVCQIIVSNSGSQSSGYDVQNSKLNFCSLFPSMCSEKSIDQQDLIELFSLGNKDTQEVRYYNGSLQVVFKGENSCGSIPRSTYINLQCYRSFSTITVDQVIEYPTCTYNIYMSGAYACPISSSDSESTSSLPNFITGNNNHNNANPISRNFGITTFLTLFITIITLKLF